MNIFFAGFCKQQDSAWPEYSIKFICGARLINNMMKRLVAKYHVNRSIRQIDRRCITDNKLHVANTGFGFFRRPFRCSGVYVQTNYSLGAEALIQHQQRLTMTKANIKYCWITISFRHHERLKIVQRDL